MYANSSASSSRFLLYLGLGAALVALAACDSSPAGPTPAEDTELQVALEQMAAEANSAGDGDAAVAFSDGLSALRFGVRPTEIAVHVDDEVVRYQALVTGIVVRTDDGRELMRRSLVAWTGPGRPVAVLQISSLTDEAVFGFPTDLAARPDPAGRARGLWANLVRGLRFVATRGPVVIELAATGGACPRVPADAPLLCAAARWDLRFEGEFHGLARRDDQQARTDVAVILAAAAEGVNGVILSRRP